MFCFATIPDHMMTVECQEYYSIIHSTEKVIKKSIYTPLLLYKIFPLNVVFVFFKSQSHLRVTYVSLTHYSPVLLFYTP